MLKNLTVPGLDVRLAFGRVRDEVLKTTGNRQEPFVYGSLGGGNIALVPAPAMPQEASTSDVKADYELVQKIGSKRAWEVFLGTHPNGFYSDLARAQIEASNRRHRREHATRLAAADDRAPGRDTPTRESLEWDRVKDSTDAAALQSFIKRYPDSPLAINAQQRMDVLKKAAAGARGPGPCGARGGAQGRGRGAAAGRIAQGRTGGARRSARKTSAAPARRRPPRRPRCRRRSRRRRKTRGRRTPRQGA